MVYLGADKDDSLNICQISRRTVKIQKEKSQKEGKKPVKSICVKEICDLNQIS